MGKGSSCHLHSNMFLLIQIRTAPSVDARSTFTFQYVSINTLHRIVLLLINIHLHSNMFLLILSQPLEEELNIFIYIPICFY